MDGWIWGGRDECMWGGMEGQMSVYGDGWVSRYEGG